MDSGSASVGKPLIWVTRPEPKATEHARLLEAHSFSTTISPVLIIEPLPLPDHPPNDLTSFSAVLVTSLNAFDHIPASWMRGLSNLPLFVSGRATERRALELGFSDVTASKGQGSRGIPNLLHQKAGMQSTHGESKLLYLAGKPRTPFLEVTLAEGHSLSVIEVYEAKLAATLDSETAAHIEGHRVAATTLFSSRSAKQAAYLLRKLSHDKQQTTLQAILAVCISPMVERAAREHGFVTTVTSELETSESMVEKLVDQLKI